MQRICSIYGGHLAVLEDLQDVDDLVALLQANIGTGVGGDLYFGSRLWVGLFAAQAPGYRCGEVVGISPPWWESRLQGIRAP